MLGAKRREKATEKSDTKRREKTRQPAGTPTYCVSIVRPQRCSGQRRASNEALFGNVIGDLRQYARLLLCERGGNALN